MHDASSIMKFFYKGLHKHQDNLQGLKKAKMINHQTWTTNANKQIIK
jgi:hypothetical protein